MFDQLERALPGNQSTQFIPLIDGDIIKYRIGFAAETKEYSLYVPSFPTMTHPHPNLPFTFDNKTDMNAFIEKHKLDKDVLYWDEKIIPDKVENALHSVKNTINSILDKIGTTRYVIYISGKNNFRDEVAFSRKYKGSREGARKPYHYQAIHDYLVSTWGAEVVDGMEADDAMGIAQMNDIEKHKARWAAIHLQGNKEQELEEFLQKNTQTIIVTLDKDLDMIPGWHYNWLQEDNSAHITGLFKWVTHKEALRSFFSQALTGDSTDDIPGVRGVGQVKAKKLLEGLSEPQEMYDVVYETYKSWVKLSNPDWSEKDVHNEAVKLMDETASLVWILRRFYGAGKPPYRHRPPRDMKLNPQELIEDEEV